MELLSTTTTTTTTTAIIIIITTATAITEISRKYSMVDGRIFVRFRAVASDILLSRVFGHNLQSTQPHNF